MTTGIAIDDEARGVLPSLKVKTLDYDRSPFLAIWEATQACDLACVHCRASARPARDCGELSLAEARRLFGQIAEMRTRMLVITGGDPLKRPDIFDLIAAAREAGLHPALSPSVTPLMTAESIRRAREAGATAFSISIDGATAETHDRFRGVPGAFERSLIAAQHVHERGMELRLNTTVTARNLAEMEPLSELAARLRAKVWSLFFLVPTGRAEASMQLSPDACERVLRWVYEKSIDAPYRIKTTEAPHYRRVVIEETAKSGGLPIAKVVEMTRSGQGRFMPGINDARGFVFISHRGDVYPSGFFPRPAGNVRETSLVSLYRDSPLFRDLRNPDLLKGRCGQCPYRFICGGSRARAFAAAGDPLAEDPLCAYEPAAN